MPQFKISCFCDKCTCACCKILNCKKYRKHDKLSWHWDCVLIKYMVQQLEF